MSHSPSPIKVRISLLAILYFCWIFSFGSIRLRNIQLIDIDDRFGNGGVAIGIIAITASHDLRR